ncbi:ubiE COQ5 methyltransferase protein [Rutstroemia sp. NJR-2017a BBW]|nr:ubiE COQ5 methyltransferase protein [Rutstroemia sp. NJR-2017a BBW]
MPCAYGLHDIQGETVVDLGCGAGFDIFQAANKIGKTGKAIGIDISEEMLARARLNAAKSSVTNVEFHQSRINTLPLPAESVDCVISNCVINLVPESDKPTVFSEIFRVLKAGGRVAISDILEKKPMGDAMRQDMGLLVGCISGASAVEEYEAWLRKAGFQGAFRPLKDGHKPILLMAGYQDIAIIDKKHDLNIYKISEVFDIKDKQIASSTDSATTSPGCCCGNGTSLKKGDASRIAEIDFNEWVGKLSDLPYL